MKYQALGVRAAKEDADALREEIEKYKYRLGEFVMAWADTEAELYRVLLRYGKLEDSVARAILSGTRASGMVNYLRTILHNRALDEEVFGEEDPISEEQRKDLDFVLAHIAAINTIRDRIIHHSSANLLQWEQSKTRILENVQRVARYGKHFVEEVGSDLLIDLTEDLYAIQNHLNQHWGKRGRFDAWTDPDTDERTTWRYRPVRPVSSNPLLGRTPRKPKPRR